MAVITQAFVNSLNTLTVFIRVGGVEVVKAQLEIGKVFFVFLLNIINELLWRGVVFSCTEHDGGAVGIICPHPGHRVITQSLKAYPDICLDVLDHVPDMNRCIGVWQRTGD